MNHSKTLLAALVLALGTALPAAAQTAGKLYKYVDANGKVYYSERPPVEATGKAMDQLSRQGAVLKQVQAALSPELVAAREADKRRAQDQLIRMREENRKNQALLDTYSSDKDIDESRSRALQAASDSIKDSQAKLAEALKRQERLKAELEFYVKKPVPAQLKQEVQNNEIELNAQRQAIDKKNKDIAAINAKYDEDKRRYLELTKGIVKPGPVVAPQTVTAASSMDKR